MNGISFTQRGFSGPVNVPGVNMRVERLEWRAVGGPWAARIRCESASLARLWGLADLLRCGVTVSDEAASRVGYMPAKTAEDLAWWGYVSAVEIHAGARVARIGLDEMFNRVAVRFRPVGPLKNLVEPQFTAWQEDAESARVYGQKEKYFFLGDATAGDATAYAAAMLEELSKPKMRAGVDPGAMLAPGQPGSGPAASGGYYAILEGRGWWETLGWRYYSEPRGRRGDLHTGAVQRMGYASGNTKIGYNVSSGSVLTWAVSEVWVYIKKVGAVTDNLILDFCASSGGAPSTVLATRTLTGSSLADSLTWTQFVLNTPVNLVTATAYWIVLRRSGSVSATDYYEAAVDESLRMADGSFRLYNGSAWVARAVDCDLTYLMSGVEESTTQIAAMLSSGAGGQFLAGARVNASSGLLARLYRDGSRTAREEIEELLRLGQTSGQRLLGRIEASRRALITAMPPESSAEVCIGEDGRIEHVDGRPLALSEQPAGRWARLGGLSAAGSLMGYEGAVFIEGVYWDGKALRLGG